MDTKQQTAVMERRFWKRLCALNRFSFFVLAGGVARAADKAGNWIEAHSAQEIVDDAECEVSALKQRIADLEARLEVDARHAYDGIACRDATIAELQAGYDAARLEIASLQERVQQLGKAARDVNSRRVIELEAQLAAVGAGGVEPLRKRCLHQISEPAQPVGWAIFAENGNGLMWTQSRQNAEATAKDIGLQVTPLYAAPQSAAPAQAGEYPELPIRYATYDAWGNQTKHGYNAKDMHAYVDADRAARGAAQAAPVDAERLDYLQECGVTVEVLPGRPGWTFRIGGLHGTVHRSVRTAIDAARAAQGGA